MQPAAAATPTCFHCALPVPAGVHLHLDIDGAERAFCCPACRAVAATIVDSGLQNYYRYRDDPDADGANAATPLERAAFELFDSADFQRRWVTALDDGRLETELLLGGMHCAACTWLIEQRLRRLPGISEVQVNLSEQRALLRWQPQQLRLAAICDAIAAIGYQPQPYGADQFEQLRRRENRDALRRLGVAGIGSMQVGMCAIALYMPDIDPHWRDWLRWASLLVSIPVVFYAGQPFFSGAWRGLRLRQPGMDLPVALAIALGFGASLWATLRGTGEVWFDSVTMFIFLLAGARYLELRARHYGGRLGHDLLSLLPATATRLAGGGQQVVPLEQLQPGDSVRVGGGQYLPADGVLLDAEAHVSEAALTGEALPVRKLRGDALLAGSINGEQPLTLRTTAVGQQLRLHAIQQLSRSAALHKPRLAQLADRWSSHFVVAVVLLAAATYLAWHVVDPARALWTALAVLVVSCPCALGLATPIAITNATTALRRRGLLVTKADAWEQLPCITDVVFDKTGTLSEGCIHVAQTRPCGSRDARVCRDIAAALESGSPHPIAQAFAAGFTGLPADGVRQVAGAGVEGRIAGRGYRLGSAEFASAGHAARLAPPDREHHWLLLADAREPLCWFRIADRTRDDAAATVAQLQRAGYAVHLLSGDRSGAVSALARELDLAHATAGATPEDKLAYVHALQRAGRRVLMIGDGINDIPVLAAADVSVAMTAASQLAKAHADCILLTPKLDRLPLLLDHARRTRHIVRENLLWALLYNVVALPLAALGLVPPWLAAVGMSLSSLLVVGNALRLLDTGRNDTARRGDGVRLP